PVSSPFPYTTLFRSRIQALAGLSHDGGWRHADAGLQLVGTQHVTYDVEINLSLDSHALPDALVVVTLLLASLEATASSITSPPRSEEHTSELQSLAY